MTGAVQLVQVGHIRLHHLLEAGRDQCERAVARDRAE
jgi:hypothetical protein